MKPTIPQSATVRRPFYQAGLDWEKKNWDPEIKTERNRGMPDGQPSGAIKGCSNQAIKGCG